MRFLSVPCDPGAVGESRAPPENSAHLRSADLSKPNAWISGLAVFPAAPFERVERRKVEHGLIHCERKERLIACKGALAAGFAFAVKSHCVLRANASPPVACSALGTGIPSVLQGSRIRWIPLRFRAAGPSVIWRRPFARADVRRGDDGLPVAGQTPRGHDHDLAHRPSVVRCSPFRVPAWPSRTHPAASRVSARVASVSATSTPYLDGLKLPLSGAGPGSDVGA